MNVTLVKNFDNDGLVFVTCCFCSIQLLVFCFFTKPI